MNPTTSGRAVYYHSERGDRLIDLESFRDRLWQVHFCLDSSYLHVLLAFDVVAYSRGFNDHDLFHKNAICLIPS